MSLLLNVLDVLFVFFVCLFFCYNRTELTENIYFQISHRVSRNGFELLERVTPVTLNIDVR